MLFAQGKLGVGKGHLHHASIINTLFVASVDSEVSSPTKFPACIPRITGMAHLMGRSEFYLDNTDPTFPGFVFRPE
jgi:proline racemase